MPQIHVTKMSGEQVMFDAEKLRRSLTRSGASPQTANEIIREMEPDLYEGIPTKVIYQWARKLLHKHSRSHAARYSLKKAIRDLGPTGYPFEKYIGALLKEEGYQTEVNVIIQGHCVKHEVDVVASQGSRQFMIECKFHSDPVNKCNVQVPLYIQSRFIDIKTREEERDGHNHIIHQGWVVTNTRFTEDALQFGTCMGLYMLSWDHPRGQSLRERIDRSGLHPVTCLSSLSGSEKQSLLNRGIVLCRQLLESLSEGPVTGVDHRKTDRIREEVIQLCHIVPKT
ncbi:MAG: restriction endonuclease [Flavobacteriales bacterium]|nr:restriction endonuclease [Flavobacteriales bacterium]